MHTPLTPSASADSFKRTRAAKERTDLCIQFGPTSDAAMQISSCTSVWKRHRLIRNDHTFDAAPLVLDAGTRGISSKMLYKHARDVRHPLPGKGEAERHCHVPCSCVHWAPLLLAHAPALPAQAPP